MAFQRPTLSELVDRVSSDFVSRLSLAGAVLRRSVLGVLSRVVAGAAHGLYGYLDYLSRQIFPDVSEAEFLERQASLFGINRVAATFSAGPVTITGTSGTVIPAGTLLQRADGTEYETQADGTISSGTVSISVQAVEAGEDGEAEESVSLSFVAPVSGANSAATVGTGGLTGGEDAEDDDSLRDRLLDRMRQPPQGGASHDYETWALEVAGVTRAWVYPQELGLGTVTVRFVCDDEDPVIPDAAKVEAVQDYIDARRPVTADVTVAAPTAVALDFEIEIVPNTTAVKAAVQAELEDLIRRDAEPGGTILLSQIKTAIGVSEGVTDFTLTDPTADVTHTTGQIATMGAITWV